MSLVLGVTGPSGSGKSTLCRSLCEHFDALHVSYGSYIRSVAAARSLPDDLRTLQKLGLELYETLGARRLTAKTLEFSGDDGTRNLVVDGIRHVDIWDACKELRRTGLFIYVDASEEELQARLAHRDGWNADYIKQVHSHRLEVQVRDQLLPLADIVVSSAQTAAAIVQVKAALEA